MRLEIKNNLDKHTYNFEVNDQQTSSIYYHFSVRLPAGIPDGEYTYTLWDEDELKASGLLQIGDYQKKVTEYGKNKTYKQYDPNGR